MQETHGVKPQALIDRPELDDDMASYVEAHSILSRTRQSSFAANPISLSEMESFCRLYKINDPPKLVQMVMLIDQVHLEKAREDSNG